MTKVTTCPQCNNTVLTSGAAPGKVIACPRCAHWFPVRAEQPHIEAPAPDAQPTPVVPLVIPENERLNALRAPHVPLAMSWPMLVISAVVIFAAGAILGGIAAKMIASDPESGIDQQGHAVRGRL
jgi:hypothetical protein